MEKELLILSMCYSPLPQKHSIHHLLNWWIIHRLAGYCLKQMYLFLTQEVKTSRMEELNQKQDWRRGRSQQENHMRSFVKNLYLLFIPILPYSGNIKIRVEEMVRSNIFNWENTQINLTTTVLQWLRKESVFHKPVGAFNLRRRRKGGKGNWA